MLNLQEYVRVTGSNGGNASGRWLYTYNPSIEHPYFISRPGFVRAKMKNHGLVGVVGDGGNTRLTYLVNIDFGGLIPSSFTTGILVSLMAYPIAVANDAKKYIKEKKVKATDITKTSPAKRGFILESDQSEEEEGASNGAALEGKRESAAELKLRTELAEMKAELVKRDDELRRKEKELRNKDEQRRSMLADKSKEIMELRRRLSRVAEGEV